MDRLLIGYGNPLRCDDGVGYFLASELCDTLHGDAVEVIAAYQLAPEMAEPMSRAREVLFIDATADADPGTWAVRPLMRNAQETLSVMVHHLTPAALLGLSQVLYGTVPVGRILTLGGADFGYGETFSEAVRAALPTVQQLALDFLNGRS